MAAKMDQPQWASQDIATYRKSLRGMSLDELTSEMIAAIEDDAPPSPNLVALNRALLAEEARHNRARVTSFPEYVFIAITDVCNARCTFCNYTPERVTAKTIGIEALARCDWLKFSTNLSLTAGLGDTFAHPGIDDILAHLRDSFPYLQVRTITNASLMGERAIESIAGYMQHINVSLNAARRETYESIMAPLKWDKTYSNLARLRDVKLALGTSLPELTASYVLSRHNLEELPELPRLCKELGFSQIRVNYMVPPPQNGSRRLMTMEDTIFDAPEKADHFIELFRQELKRVGMNLARPLPLISENGPDASVWHDEAEEDQPDETSSPGGLPGDNSTDDPKWDQKRPDVSNEFVKSVMAGEKPWCNRPWSYLNVDLADRTTVCCSFFQKFPAFDWKPVREFHDGFWNHPAMQHMRATLNAKDEVPFCTFCKTKDKRDARHSEERARVATESRNIITGVLEEHSGAGRNVRLEHFDPKRHPIDLSAIAEQRRNHLRSKALVDFDRVLVLGINGVDTLPFLAEANREVVAIDERPGPIRKVRELAEAYGCDNVQTAETDSVYDLDSLEGKFDLVLVSPIILYASDRKVLLEAIKERLTETHRVTVLGALGYAAMLKRHLIWRKRSNDKMMPGPDLAWLAQNHRSMSLGARIAACDAMIPDALERGPGSDSPGNFLAMETLLKVSNRWPLVLDRKNFPVVNRVGGGKVGIGKLEKELGQLGDLARDAQFMSELDSGFDTVCMGLERSIVLSLRQ